MKIKRYILKTILVLKKINLIPKSITKFCFGYDYQSFKFENIELYALTHPQKVKCFFNTPVTLFYSAPRFNDIAAAINMKEVKGLKHYGAMLKDVEVIGSSNLVVLDDRHALYDIKYHDKHSKMYYNDLGICYYHNDYLLIKNRRLKPVVDVAIFLGGNFSNNYYHLLFEIFVKFQKINEMSLDSAIPVLVDKDCYDIPQFFELFSLLNIKNRKAILLDKSKRYVVKELYHFSCPNIIPPDLLNVNEIQPEDVLFDLKTLDFLRSNLLPHSSKKSFPKRIFISRSKASGRRIFNEDEIFEVLQKHDFKIIFPEDYSIADQISLFNNAEFIAGGAGAAFTNVIFCNKLCKVFVFTKYTLPASGFSTIAKYAGVEMLYITGQSGNSANAKNVHEPFTIDTKKVDLLVSEWI